MNTNRKDLVVPFGDGRLAFLYRGALVYVDKMSNEERYEANIRADFRTRSPRQVYDHGGVSVVRISKDTLLGDSSTIDSKD